MQYLITGGAGFIGANLTRYLIDQGHSVRIFDNFAAGRFPERLDNRAEYIEGSILDRENLRKACEGIDGIFHLAALPRVSYSVEHPLETHDVNLTGLLYVLEAARAAKVKRLVFSSSSAAWGDQSEYPVPDTAIPRPISPYGFHKLAGEHYCRIWSRLYGLETVSLRYFNIYGPFMDPHGAYALVIGKFIWQKKQGEPLTICGDGEYFRDYTHVSDVARANLLAMTKDSVGQGEVIEIGGGNPCSVNALAKLIGGETTSIPPRAADMRFTKANTTKAKELLGWEPEVKLIDGVQRLREEWGVT